MRLCVRSLVPFAVPQFPKNLIFSKFEGYFSLAFNPGRSSEVLAMLEFVTLCLSDEPFKKPRYCCALYVSNLGSPAPPPNSKRRIPLPSDAAKVCSKKNVYIKTTTPHHLKSANVLNLYPCGGMNRSFAGFTPTSKPLHITISLFVRERVYIQSALRAFGSAE
ncbi:uncharacterized protein EI90DRAFT_3151003 [Cantharellus anzutake]|uniref:uncharacterized protein n=1 Tax=Cantharellus anzutake TaxID=1750568 RepID=UPI0019065AC4|nr:uncharacterized protein EI90DRAFT_3151003 [Cantharellus anzutake]KAF8340723.1 hypothetical protein EI90DRAFT_3151003 [Cantharellus anzutake]